MSIPSQPVVSSLTHRILADACTVMGFTDAWALVLHDALFCRCESSLLQTASRGGDVMISSLQETDRSKFVK